MRLRHLHLPGLTPYLRASALQDRIVRAYLDYKAARTSSPPPEPTLLTFQTPPTYTCGRREIGTLNETQIAHLRADGKAEFYEALRGGQTTFHGPGQLTAYLIISLQEHALNTRRHIRLLEDAVIGTCKHYALTTHTTENPGVWIGFEPDDRKIASVGVHLRRNIASHGVGLNVSVDLSWFHRIVACGLVGKRATNIEAECQSLHDPWARHHQPPRHSLLRACTEGRDMQQMRGDSIPIIEVADVFAKNLITRVPGLDSQILDRLTEQEIR